MKTYAFVTYKTFVLSLKNSTTTILFFYNEVNLDIKGMTNEM